MTTIHYSNERAEREALINRIGEGVIVKSFVVDRHHKNGAEVHSVTNNGIIVIYNKNSGRLVTKLIARPNQIRRYWEAEGKVAPQYIVRIAYEHQKLGYNKR